MRRSAHARTRDDVSFVRVDHKPGFPPGSSAPPEEAEGELKIAYDEMMEEAGGRLPRVLSVLSLNPRALQSLRALNRAVTFGGSTLGRRREEMLATAISTWNDCHY